MQITVEAQNIKRGDVLGNGEWVKEVYVNGEKVAATTSASVWMFFAGEMVTVERN